MRDVLSIVCLGMIALSSAVLSSGCGGGPEGGSDVKLAEGGGIVKYNGAPVAGASVTFIPKNGPVAFGTTDLGGKFKLATGALPGVAIGECKVTVSAYEAGGKPAASSPGPPTGGPKNPEEMRAKMAAAAKQMQESAANAAASTGPKSIIPEKYGKPTSTDLSYTVVADASKNQFTIELKD